MNWDPGEAVSYARRHAHLHTTHFCARAVAAAINAGGVRIDSADARNFEYSLMKAGFSQVYGEPVKGDIAVINPFSGSMYGHVCIYDGQGTWYSDFTQRSMYPGPGYRKAAPAFKIYRHP
nr:CHAP domain-containing protein [Scandinavium goeteborgense]